MSGPGPAPATDGQDSDRVPATGGASYPVRHSYGATYGPDPAPGGEDGTSGLRTRAPEDPTEDRHQGAPVSGEKPYVRVPRRRTRNPKPRSRTQFFTVRVNADEYTEITAAARTRAVTAARFLATAGLAAARGTSTLEATAQRDAVVDELASLRAHLARVGNNVNQLARGANVGVVPHPDELAFTLTRLRKTIAVVDRAADALVTRRPS
ncbi:plasmid mobilization protein [Streptomyces acidiscabies]|uniref:Plasmid mobilization relaxosome protein MobC n=1 Tax=Streptomyces acidiscabies TaxID=42234 RepID=A0AAP6BLQ4_9ACTN|nr:plasmid mobilization relaxosome protein MobC [Streptomyces acidiscabies]MBP5936734.1 MobC family plasmid mobilization relaxosome protein [Streptomyces sp. LBUM 1476]MBZ3915260.1 plasmid mobilization relaxosome protein MobC [Streptomyces acidiscabies]MDX2967021.1 plasmid mobilization relaxosome protein MobC [Streptomyces acidiscabies]MDX3021322.1 plasmid mobilization relaxosome protein MobC [Streptomyces acidiscabies]MDX3793425.1 plasmid mobilization relaxosome protein MobC [Streptomyces aci